MDKIEDLKNVGLNALPIYYDRYIKNKITTYSDNVYTNFRSLKVLEDDIEYESVTVISIDFLLVYENKYYLQVYLDNCADEIQTKQMTDYLDDKLFNNGFQFQDSVCNGCHDMTALSVNISDIAIITVKDVDCCCIIHNISKSEAINLLENYVLEDHG